MTRVQLLRGRLKKLGDVSVYSYFLRVGDLINTTSRRTRARALSSVKADFNNKSLKRNDL